MARAADTARPVGQQFAVLKGPGLCCRPPCWRAPFPAAHPLGLEAALSFRQSGVGGSKAVAQPCGQAQGGVGLRSRSQHRHHLPL